MSNQEASSSSTVIGGCQICKGGDHLATACPRLNEARPKCAKCGMPHRTESCGVKCNYYAGLGHFEDRCWKKPKNEKSPSRAANYLEVLISDEAATLQQLNKLCGSENIFSHTRVPRRRVPVEVATGGDVPTPQIVGDGLGVDRDVVVRSKILSHFIKGVITQALGMISEVPVKVGGVQCTMTFMVVNTDSYDVLLGLDFLMKIGAIVDVECGLIQVRHGPGANVEVLPLTMVNLLQRVESANMVPESTSVWRSSSTGDNSDRVADPERTTTPKEDAAISSDSDMGTEGNEHGEVFVDLMKQFEYEDEFGEDELAKLIEAKGPPEILQLILQEQADDFMHEEITEGDDYADWIRWVADAEQSMRDERTPKDIVTLVSQQHRSTDTASVSTLQQVIPTRNDESECATIARLGSSIHEERDTRWSEICQRIKVDRNLDEGRQQQLWGVLE